MKALITSNAVLSEVAGPMGLPRAPMEMSTMHISR